MVYLTGDTHGELDRFKNGELRRAGKGDFVHCKKADAKRKRSNISGSSDHFKRYRRHPCCLFFL